MNRTRVGLALTASLLLPSLGAAIAPGAAQAATTSAPATSSVTFLLASQNPATLSHLAQARGLTPATRAHQLESALPAARTRAVVIGALTTRGLRIANQTPWSVTAAGSTATINSIVGSLKSVRHSGVSGPATTLPELKGLVTGVVGGDDTARAVSPMTVTPQTGTTLQSLYSAPDGKPTGGSPLTVATLQFSGWNSHDLTAYAAKLGVPDPVAAKTYVPVSVDGASVSTPDGFGGEVEVALDQEALLAVSPNAHQRAYFAPNTHKGFVDALLAVATDATTGHSDIAALSISWGACEKQWGSAMGAVDQALAKVLAAGVTVFAASGDGGATDCAFDNSLAVDFPASDPHVVGVGGTTVDGTSQSGWSGSGGGVSNTWPTPAYQAPLVGKVVAFRQVPDIAADADPASGLNIVTGGALKLFGGTSLATPLSAGLFTNSLAAGGWTSGVGNILPSLYAAPSTSFVDITSGDNNGFLATTGYDNVTGRGSPLWSALSAQYQKSPTLRAAPTSRTRAVPVQVTVPTGMTYLRWTSGTGTPPAGCDVTAGSSTPPAAVITGRDGLTGLWVKGAASDKNCYTATTTVTVDSTAPLVRVSAGLTTPTNNLVTFRWSAVDVGSGVASYGVTVTHPGTRTPDFSRVITGATSFQMRGVPGLTYTVAVTATDRFGNRARSTTAAVTVPLDDRAFAFRGSWRHATSSPSYLRTVSIASKTGASATAGVAASRYVLLMVSCPTCGKASLYLSGKLVRTVDLYSPTTRYRVPIALGSGAYAKRTILIKVLNARNARSHGTAVLLDGLIASR